METKSFEEAQAVEAAIAALQDGKLPLDQSLQYYQERGMKLAQHCNELFPKAGVLPAIGH